MNTTIQLGGYTHKSGNVFNIRINGGIVLSTYDANRIMEEYNSYLENGATDLSDKEDIDMINTVALASNLKG